MGPEARPVAVPQGRHRRRDLTVEKSPAAAIRVLKAADVPRQPLGGVKIFMVESGAALEELGHVVVDYLFRDDLAPRVRYGGFRRLLVPWCLLLRVLALRASGRRYDVVEIHEPLAAPYGFFRRLLPALLPPYAVMSYGTETRYWRARTERAAARSVRLSLKSRLLVPITLLAQSRYALKHAQQVMVPSDEDAVYLRDELGLPESRIARVNSGVDEAFFEVKRVRADGPPKILFVGTCIDRKGIPELAEAWSIVSRRCPDATLTLAGTVAGEDEVLRHFAAGVDRIVVRPQVSRDELVALLSDHDLFVLPAWFEGGTPLALLQAAAAGLPSVVTQIGGHVEVIRPASQGADGGVLIPPHDAEALARAIEALIADPGRLSKLGDRARARARFFTWRETAEQSVRAYVAATD